MNHKNTNIFYHLTIQDVNSQIAQTIDLRPFARNVRINYIKKYIFFNKISHTFLVTCLKSTACSTRGYFNELFKVYTIQQNSLSSRSSFQSHSRATIQTLFTVTIKSRMRSVFTEIQVIGTPIHSAWSVSTTKTTRRTE